MPFAFQSEVTRQVNELVEWGLIYPMQSKSAHTIVCVTKRNGGVHCVLTATSPMPLWSLTRLYGQSNGAVVRSGGVCYIIVIQKCQLRGAVGLVAPLDCFMGWAEPPPAPAQDFFLRAWLVSAPVDIRLSAVLSANYCLPHC